MTELTVESSAEAVVDLNEKKPMRVLHVDDEVGLLKVAKQCLELQGPFQVDTAGSVEEALAKLQNEQHDVVVSDYQMPGKDGLAFLKELRQKGNGVPFIMFTGKGREEVAMEALNLGADQYINKTGDPAAAYCELAHAIRKTVERKRAQEEKIATQTALKICGENYGRLFDSTIEGIIINGSDGKISSLNPAAAKILGYSSPKELVGTPIVELYADPDDRACTLQELKKNGCVKDHALTWKKKDGALIEIEASVTARKDERGNLLRVEGMIRDVSERKTSERFLRESEQKYRELAEGISDVFFAMDKNLRYTYWNKASEKLTGIKAKDAIGKSLTEVFPDVKGTKVEQFYRSVIETKQHQTFVNKYQVRDEDFIFELNAYATKDGLSVFVKDITERKKREEELRESEERFRNIVENSQDVIMLTQPDGIISYLSPACSKVLGYEPAELVGKQPWIFHPDDLERVKAAHYDALKGRNGSNLEYRVKTKTGETRWVSHSWSPMIADNKVKLIVSVVRDITEQKRMDEVFRKSEVKYRSLVEQSMQGIVIAQGPIPHIVFVNSAMSKILGYTVEELTSLSPQQTTGLVHPDDRELFFGRFKDRLEGKPAPTQYEVRGIRKDGTIVWLELSSAHIKYDGQPAVQAIFMDITERRQMEKQLKESEEKYRNLVENSQDAIAIVDFKGNILFANKAAETLTGYTPKDGKRLNIRAVTPMRLWPKSVAMLLKARMGKPIPYFEYELKRKDGTIVPVETGGQAVYEDGKPVAIQIITREVTERRKTEEALRQSEEKYRDLFENAMDAILTLDLKGSITAVNNSVLRFGYKKEDLVGRNFLDFVSKEYWPAVMRDFSKVAQGEPAKNETELAAPAGKIHVEYHARAIVKENNVVGVQINIRDVTERKKSEELLRESEERFRGLFESIRDPVGIFVGREGRLIDYNAAFKRSSGYTDEELKGKAFLDFVHPDDHALVLEKYQTEYSEEELPLVYEIRGMNKKGESLPLEISVSTYKKKGRAIGIEVIHRDITERKRYERSLSTLNTYSLRLNTAKSMEEIYELTLDAAEKTLGFEFADVFMVKGKMLQLVTHRGKTKVSSLSLPMDGDRGISVRAARTGKLVLIPDISKEEAYVEGEEGARSELAVPIKIGPRVLGALNVESRELDAFNKKEQELLEILASHAATAISNLDHARELEAYALEIQETKHKFEGLFLGNPEATVYLAPDFRILDINPRFEELFGYSLSEIKGKHIDEVVVPKDKMKEAKMLDGKAVEGYVYHDTFRMRKDGSLVPVSISAAPIKVEDKLVGYIGVYKDISDLKKIEKNLEEINEKLQVVGQLTRHDVRNKLSTITGNVYLLKKQLASNSEILDKLRDMETAVQKVTKIFDFAKAYETLGAEKLAYIDVGKAVDEAVALFPDLKGVKMTNSCQGLTVLADSLLRQLFYNLIDNSLKYGQEITNIGTHYEQTSQGELRLTYEDDGVGIPETKKPKLFKQGYSTGGSTGYGLYLIRKMIEVYGWTIQETGTPGKGAQFTITIPKTNQTREENYRLQGA